MPAKPINISFLECLDIDLKNFFLQYIGVFPFIHISTLLLSQYPQFVETMWITRFFDLFFIHYPPKIHVFGTKSRSGIIIKSIVIHNFINIFL